MRRGVGQLLLESFAEAIVYIGAVAGVFLAVFLFVVAPLDLIGRILAGVLALYGFLSAAAIYALVRALMRQSRTSVFPRIRMGMQPRIGTSATFACIADPSEFFYHGSWVSFYRIGAEGFEEPIGIGRVINVQDDGKLLLQMERVVLKEHEDFAGRVRNNDPEALERLRVKPYVLQQMFGSYEEYR